MRRTGPSLTSRALAWSNATGSYAEPMPLLCTVGRWERESVNLAMAAQVPGRHPRLVPWPLLGGAQVARP
jgi:hypothetical protein